mgnify:CR=1 FL=1
MPWEDLRGSTWRLTDAFSGEVFERGGDEMRDGRLFVALPPWGFHFLRVGRPSLTQSPYTARA